MTSIGIRHVKQITNDALRLHQTISIYKQEVVFSCKEIHEFDNR